MAVVAWWASAGLDRLDRNRGASPLRSEHPAEGALPDDLPEHHLSLLKGGQPEVI